MAHSGCTFFSFSSTTSSTTLLLHRFFSTGFFLCPYCGNIYARSFSYPADSGCPQDNGNDDVLIVVRIGSVFGDGLFWSATQKAPKRKMSNNKLFVFIIEFFWFPALLGSLFFPSPRLSLDRVTESPPPPDNRFPLPGVIQCLPAAAHRVFSFHGRSIDK